MKHPAGYWQAILFVTLVYYLRDLDGKDIQMLQEPQIDLAGCHSCQEFGYETEPCLFHNCRSLSHERI
jgi:hypothetical protein